MADANIQEDLKLPWENKGVGSGKLKKYFDLITDQEVEQLYKKFEVDFIMFDYNIDDDF